MAFNSLNRINIPISNRNMFSSGSRLNFSLNSAYVHLTSGQGIAIRFSAGSTSGLSNCRVFLDATTGTRSNVILRARLYEGNASTVQPNATLIDTASSVTYPAGDDQWINATFSSPPALSIGRYYFVVFDNTAIAPATDFPAVMSVTNTLISTETGLASQMLSTANGFSTAGTSLVEGPHILTFANGLSVGQPFTQQATIFASNTRWRGLWLPNIAKNLEYYIFYGTNTMQEIRVYRSDQLPADTPIYSRTVNADERVSVICHLSPVLKLSGSTDFYLVVDSNVANVNPGGGIVEDYSSISSVVDGMYADNLGYVRGVQDNGSNGWNLFSSAPNSCTLVANGNIVGGGLIFPRGFDGGLG